MFGVGEVYWEIALANSIVPDKCSLKLGKYRAELKMRKEEAMPSWSDYEVKKVRFQ